MGIFHIDRLHERAKYANGPIRKLYKDNADVITFSWQEMLDEVNRVSSKWIYMFAGDKTGLVRTYFSEHDCMTRLGVWEKTNPTPLHGQYIWLSSLEPFSIARKHGGDFYKHCQSPVLRYPNGSSKYHPTEKPLKLIAEIIESSTNQNDTIFDPFMGSGTTGVACMQLGRNFIGCEIDQNYYAIAEKRIKQAQRQMIMPLG
jgi:site-specific DNA-methyltransferase (adenine-specific)